MKLKSISLILCAICPLIFLTLAQSASAQFPGGISSDYIKDRFNQDRRRIIRYAEVLGLKDKQLDKIDLIKLNLEKEMVLYDARIEVIDLDLRAKLSEDQVDMNRVKELLNEKYVIERKRMEGQAAAYASLKGILSPEQREQMRGSQEIFRGPYGRRASVEE